MKNIKPVPRKAPSSSATHPAALVALAGMLKQTGDKTLAKRAELLRSQAYDALRAGRPEMGPTLDS